MSLPQIEDIKTLTNDELSKEILKVKKVYLIYVLKNQHVKLLNRMKLSMQNID
jgi:ribosomal protein L29